MAKQKGTPKTGGRQKGTPNKVTTLLKDAILRAAEDAGGKEGLVGYLKTQAKENPSSFMTLLGKVLPTQLTGDEEALIPQVVIFKTTYGDQAAGIPPTPYVYGENDPLRLIK